VYPDIDDLNDVELNIPDPRSYGGDASRLTMPHVTGLRNKLTPRSKRTVPVLFTAPNGSRVEGLVQVADWPASSGPVHRNPANRYPEVVRDVPARRVCPAGAARRDSCRYCAGGMSRRSGRDIDRICQGARRTRFV